MNGMLRDLLSERADAAGGPDLDLARPDRPGRATHQRAVVARPWAALRLRWR